MRASIQALVLLSVVTSVIGRLYTSPSQLPTKTFDYVIVGAGAAGPVVANRLSEDKDVSVLLLEAGESNEVDEMIAAPLLGPTLTPNTRLDWNYSTIPQIGYNSRSVPYIRGHVLGGTTSINYMIHNTGPIDDWEYYAKLTGDQGWSWQAMRKYFYKAERMVPPADGHYIKGQWDPKVHGKDGMVKLSLPGKSIPLDLLVLSATEEFHKELPYNVDQNSGKPLGIGWAQTRTGDGLRDSSATSYLGPKYLARPNLHVLLHARVTRVYPTGRTARDGKLVFRGVEFLSAPALTALTKVEARKEVILSAGVINTPYILQLSGIGERIELARVGIKQLVNLPSVGKNMSDHPLLLPTWNVTSKDTFDPIMRNDSDFAPEFQKWKKTRKGVMTDTVANLIAWHRLPSTDRAFKVTGARDPSTGPNAPHVELIFYNSFFDPHGFPHPSSGNYMTIFVVLVSPSSRGFVTLSSNSPLTPPVINPNYFGDPFDSHAITSGLKLADKIVTSDPWKGYIKGRFGKAFEDARTDDELLDYVVNNAFCLFHGVGTASMSPKGASWGVVDPDLRVKGVVGLRVVDASVIPYVPSAHPMGPIYAVAERASELIKVESASIETEIGNILPYNDETQKSLFIFGLLSGLTGQPALILGAILAALAYLGVFRKRS